MDSSPGHQPRPAIGPWQRVGPIDEETFVNVTRAAADVIELVREEHQVPEEFGVRLFPAGTRPDETTVAIDFAATPSDGDEVSEQHGTMVFVAQDVASVLAHAELDAIRQGPSDGERPLRLVLRARGDSRLVDDRGRRGGDDASA